MSLLECITTIIVTILIVFVVGFYVYLDYKSTIEEIKNHNKKD